MMAYPKAVSGGVAGATTSVEALPREAMAPAATVADYIALLKPRVMSLVVFTGLVGMAVAPGQLHPILAFTALLCIAVGAGASGAINMWYDADIDAGMARTRGRPIPRGRIAPGEALGFGATLAVGSTVVMGLLVNLVAAALLALTIAFYVFVYTIWLKRRTPQNIVIGGAAGAFPPMIGWAAVTGHVGLPSLALFALIFMWTPPHFWALALYRSGDYAKVGVPMLPVVAGPRETRRQILIYTLLLIPVSYGPWFFGIGGSFYAAVAGVLDALLLLAAVRVWRDASDRPAKQMFGFSILYLFLLFAALLAEALVRVSA
ncbi:MAG TPA: heme o synthase [Candidatus Sulfotelmatobacter sp.]|nr:heme o synthase [Candidatus Sulfotelmatobacter sp.]